MSTADIYSPESHTHEITFVAINTLRGADSPRLDGINEAHAALLAEAESELPPILVDRNTMRIIDGMHRMRAAQLNNQTTIKVRLIETDDESAFLAAVAENIRHGLPLTMADRRAAAKRILEKSPEWSDRAVARAVGLSGKTVAAVRRKNGGEFETCYRTGLDGRERAVDSKGGRQKAIELLAAQPKASLKQIAAQAGVSVSTVRNVQSRSADGSETEVEKHSPPSDSPASGMSNNAVLLNILRQDPALRYSDAGRIFLSWLAGSVGNNAVEGVVEALPSHCLPLVVDLTHNYAIFWRRFTELASRRASRVSS